MENFLDKILKVKPIVLEILKTNLESRDDDNILILNVWEKQFKIETKKIDEFNNYIEFKHLLLNGRLSPPESITRSRRKLQEDNIELRGKLYDERQKQEKIIKNQLKIDF